MVVRGKLIGEIFKGLYELWINEIMYHMVRTKPSQALWEKAEYNLSNEEKI